MLARVTEPGFEVTSTIEKWSLSELMQISLPW